MTFIKELERDLFGEEKYEESIAERVKTRRQNTQRTFAPENFFAFAPAHLKKIILKKLLIF